MCVWVWLGCIQNPMPVLGMGAAVNPHHAGPPPAECLRVWNRQREGHTNSIVKGKGSQGVSSGHQ